ncbi:hypothetical protein P7C73_g5894, partial [Tremellales sp. Uapishka_1]
MSSTARQTVLDKEFHDLTCMICHRPASNFLKRDDYDEEARKEMMSEDQVLEYTCDREDCEKVPAWKANTSGVLVDKACDLSPEKADYYRYYYNARPEGSRSDLKALVKAYNPEHSELLTSRDVSSQEPSASSSKPKSEKRRARQSFTTSGSKLTKTVHTKEGN